MSEAVGWFESAASVTDGIAHTGVDFAFGLSIMVVGAGIVLVPFGVGSILAFAGAASTAQGIGGLIDRVAPKNTDEKVLTGSATVFLGVGRQPAARAVQLTTVSNHPGDWVCSGSSTVFIEMCNASRISDETTCAGTILTGAPNIFYGGDKEFAPGGVVGPERKGSPAYERYSRLLGAVGFFSRPKNAWEASVYALSLLDASGAGPDGLGDALLANGVRSQAWSAWTSLKGIGK